MNELSTQPDFVITIPGYVEAMHVYEEGVEKHNFDEDSMLCRHVKNAYRAIESFLPYDIGTVIVYANSQCETLYKSAWGQEVQLTGKSGDEFKYFVIGKEIVDLQKERILVHSGRREIKIVLPWPLYGFDGFSGYNLVLRAVNISGWRQQGNQFK